MTLEKKAAELQQALNFILHEVDVISQGECSEMGPAASRRSRARNDGSMRRSPHHPSGGSTRFQQFVDPGPAADRAGGDCAGASGCSPKAANAGANAGAALARYRAARRVSRSLRGSASGEGRWWWVHAVSMGEVKAIETFLRRAPKEAGVKVLLTAVTPEAIAWASEQKVADVVIAAPIDLPWIVRRVFRAVRPAVFISVESEFWPNLLREANRSGAKVGSDQRAHLGAFISSPMRAFSRFCSALWEMFDLFAVRQSQDAQRFAALGVPAEKIQVTGNLKYDLYLERRAPRNAC